MQVRVLSGARRITIVQSKEKLMINISPRVVGIIIVSLIAIVFFTAVFMVDPIAVVAMIVTLLVITLLIFGINLISEGEWPWEQ